MDATPRVLKSSLSEFRSQPGMPGFRHRPPRVSGWLKKPAKKTGAGISDHFDRALATPGTRTAQAILTKACLLGGNERRLLGVENK